MIKINQVLSESQILSESVYKLEELEKHINIAPVTYEQDGIEDPVVFLVYVLQNGGFAFITEMDKCNEQHQAFGYISITGSVHDAELGYIDIEALKECAVVWTDASLAKMTLSYYKQFVKQMAI